jgi:pimeloyl-ACP methyl ester carboxylesterase
MPRPLPEVPGVEHRYVDAGGLRVHVAEAGAGDPIVLLHGWPQHWYAWRRLIPRLAQDRRVICPDLRGLGWTDAPPDGYEKEELASDLLATLDALDLDRVTLVAHDWGAFAGFLACLRAPERFDRFLAMSIITPWFRPKLSPSTIAKAAYQFVIIAPLIGRLVVQRVPSFIRTVLRRGAGPGHRWSDEELSTFGDQFRERERAAATVGIYRSFQLRELRPMAAGRYADQRLTVPTLLLYGEHDPVVAADSIGAWRDRADDMRVEEIAGAGHFTAEEAPDEVLARFSEFVERSSVRG